MSGADFERLVIDAYAAAADSDHWPAFLAHMRASFGADSATLQIHDLENLAGAIALSSGTDSATEHAYNSYYAALNPWVTSAGAALRPGRVLTSEMVLTPDALERTEFYADFLRPAGLRHSVAAVVQRSDSTIAFFALQLSRKRGALADEDIERVERLMPHLTRAVELHRRVGALREQHRALRDTLDLTPWAVLLVDRRWRIVFANRRAAAIERATLARVLLAAQSGGGAVLREEAPPLAVTVAPLAEANPFDAVDAATRIVVVVDPAHERGLPESWLREAFGLTPAEARLAMALARGASLDEIAGSTNVRVATLRAHLKRVFSKTGTRRQSELVRLVLLGAGPG